MLRGWISRIRGLLFRRRLEAEFSSEIETHLALMSEDLVRRGMSPADARREARRQFGGVTQVQELHREGRGLAFLDQAAADFRYALRMLRRNPGFTVVAVVTLALGIGVNTTLFTAYNAAVLKPLPVSDPDRVVRMERWFASRNQGDIQYAFSYPEYLYLRDHTRSFAGLAASSWPVRIFAQWGGERAADRLQGQLVSANYFASMGVPARFGRTFAEDEDRLPGGNPVVVLSFHAWQRVFQSDPSVVGRVINLNGTPFTVIGITHPEFTGTSIALAVPDFWAPLSMQGQLAPGRNWLGDPNEQTFQILARMNDRTTFAGARSEASLLLGQFAATHIEHDKTTSLTLQRTAFFGNTEDPRFQAAVAAIMLTVGLVLMVACANIANMLLARGASRQKEIGLRLAMGASRARVVRQLLTESVTLGLAGGVVGLLLSNWTSRLLWLAIENTLLRPFAPDLTMGIDLTPDFRVYVYALAVSFATGILFGLSPALQFTRLDLSSSLKDEGTGLARSWNRSRLRSFLVASQVAVSMLLLITAGLLLRGTLRSKVADPGFDTRSLYILNADFGVHAARSIERQRRLLEQLASSHVVANVAFGGVPMLGTWTPPIFVGQERGRTLASRASDTYLETVGIPLVRGRNFTRAEVANGTRVAVISEAAARTFWPVNDPLGQHFRLDMDFRGHMAEFEVIGVAKDVRFANPTRLDPAHVYVTPQAADFENALLRAYGDPQRVVAAIRAVVENGRSRATARSHSDFRGSRTAEVAEIIRRGRRGGCGHSGGTRPSARRGRNLRRDGLPGQPADQGDRRPHGARRVRGRLGAWRSSERPAPGDFRDCGRDGGRRRSLCGVALDALLPRGGGPLIWCELLRSSDVSRAGRIPDAGGRAGECGPGAPCGAGRPRGGAALRVSKQGTCEQSAWFRGGRLPATGGLQNTHQARTGVCR